MKSKNIIFGLFMFVSGNIMTTNLCHATRIENNQIQQGETQMSEEKGLWQHTKEGTAKAWDKTKEVSGNIWEGTKEFSGDVWEGTKNVTEDVWEGTKEFSGDVWEGTKNVGNSVKNAITGEKEAHKRTENSHSAHNVSADSANSSSAHYQEEEIPHSTERHAAPKMYHEMMDEDEITPHHFNRH
jgi:hypothetical protein